MAKLKYEDWNPGADAIATVNHANAIIKEYQAQGLTLTLRQLYYQFVARDLCPNKTREYDRLGTVLSRARLAGLVDWLAMEDRTRGTSVPMVFASPQDRITRAAQNYQRDLWVGQPRRVEVWIEKEALVGVVEDVCAEFQVPYLACRGYVSQSEQWRAAMRLRAYAVGPEKAADTGAKRQRASGARPLVLHLGDHDPSGIDMTRDNRDRLRQLSAYDSIEVKRLALTMAQVDELQPPPNPAKMTDSRAEDYVSKYGAESWELDALSPDYIVNLIRENIEEVLDRDKFDALYEQQEQERAHLLAAAASWDLVTNIVNGPKDE